MKESTPKNTDPAVQVIDIALIEAVMNKFDLSTLEAIRLEATFSGCRYKIDGAKTLIDGDWNSMTVKLLFNGFITMPKKGPTIITPKAARFLAICDKPIIKN